jgi:hypothetical protein
MPPEFLRLAEALDGLPLWFKRLESGLDSLYMLGVAWAMLYPTSPQVPSWLALVACWLSALLYWRYWSLPLAFCVLVLAIVAVHAMARKQRPMARHCIALAGLCLAVSAAGLL